MPKLIIFDFWGTLINQGVYSPLKQVRNILRIDMPFSDFVIRFENVFMTDVFPDLKSAFEAVINEFNVRVPDFVVEKLIGMWNKNRLLAEPFPETLEVLKALKKDYKLALLSNTDGFSIPTVIEKYKLEKYFDFMYFSYKEGYLKTDPKSFEKILSTLKIKKEDTIMVGDSLESDMGGAEKAGVRGILVDRRGRREYPEKIPTLKELKEKL